MSTEVNSSKDGDGVSKITQMSP